MSDLKVFRIRDGRATEVPGTSLAVERELQPLIETNMEAMLGVRFPASEYRAGRHRGRVDSLGLDEKGTPVVVEYKRSRNQNVMSQALSYLAWLRGHHHEFERLVTDRLGAKVAGAVDWINPWVVCVAGEFTYSSRKGLPGRTHAGTRRTALVRADAAQRWPPGGRPPMWRHRSRHS